MFKFKKIYLPILVSVAMNTCNVHASAAAGNDPRDVANRTASSPAPSSHAPSFSTDAFDPEKSEFSKLATLDTWVDPKYSESLKDIQRNVAMTAKENPFSVHFIMCVPINPNQTRDYGKTFPTIASIELPFLRHVSGLSKSGISPLTLEIAGAFGLVSWKMPFAFGGKGTHVVNELSQKAVDGLRVMLSNRLPGELAKTVEIDQGDCFDILARQPKLRGSVNAIFVQNLEHFFNPNQHQRFLALVNELLAEGGQAYLCSHSFVFGIDGNHPLYKLHRERKAIKDIYPGFYKCDVTFEQFKGSPLQRGETTMSNTERPDDDAEVTKVNISKETIGWSSLPGTGKPTDVLKITQQIVSNAFSPSIYRAAIGQIPTLEVVDAFFVDTNGYRAEKWRENISHAAAIIRKKVH